MRIVKLKVSAATRTPNRELVNQPARYRRESILGNEGYAPETPSKAARNLDRAALLN
jgi:hypothetical protein